MEHSSAFFTTKTMVLTALVTAVTCILAPLSVPIPVSPVPITLTNLVILISVYILGWKRAVLSTFIYLLLGLAGLPVFSGFGSGPAKLLGPTGGYLIGFLFLAVIAGITVEKFSTNKVLILLGMIAATIVMYAFGTAWLAVQMNLSFGAALGVGVIPYLPGDLVKIILAILIGPILQRRIHAAVR